MIKFLVKKLIKNHEDVKDNKVREKYGVLGGVLGIICNLILFALKLMIGILVNAVAIMSDAFNNLTDNLNSLKKMSDDEKINLFKKLALNRAKMYDSSIS